MHLDFEQPDWLLFCLRGTWSGIFSTTFSPTLPLWPSFCFCFNGSIASPLLRISRTNNPVFIQAATNFFHWTKEVVA
jgi:hypothetical protein